MIKRSLTNIKLIGLLNMMENFYALGFTKCWKFSQELCIMSLYFLCNYWHILPSANFSKNALKSTKFCQFSCSLNLQVNIFSWIFKVRIVFFLISKWMVSGIEMKEEEQTAGDDIFRNHRLWNFLFFPLAWSGHIGLVSSLLNILFSN